MKRSMRRMRPADLPRVQQLAQEQNKRDGTSYPVPSVFDATGKQLANAPLALVTVDENDFVRQAHIFMRTVEMCSFGNDPHALSVSLEAINAVCFLLAEQGYMDLHVQVPLGKWRRFNRFGSVVAKALQRIGFARDDHRLAHFYRELRNEDQL